ncbi:MAG: hypothetical protein JW825_05965 [Candidatus Methanofastidiosa archaeon]|nr:hypothetical protein [Candidatus Methanofastidiosa archaeon]
MRKWLLLLSIVLILSTKASMAQETYDYDVIIVRNDIPVEYIIALPYSVMHNIPIIQVSQNVLSDQEYEQLLGYFENGARRVLILGGTQNAVSEAVSEEIHSIGYSVDRKWGVARESTAAIFAMDFWESSDDVVLLSGSDTRSFLMGARIAMILECPILLTEAGTLSTSVTEAIADLGVKTAYVIEGSLSEDILGSIVELGVSINSIGAETDQHSIAKEKGMSYDIVLFLVGLLIGGAATYIARSRRRESALEVPMFVLTEDERKVVEAIENKDGELKQDMLPDLTNFSRPKVSRIVNDLESKKILLREKHGKTYKVKTAKKFINND